MSRSKEYLLEYNKFLILKNYSPQTIKSYNNVIIKFFKFSKQCSYKKQTVRIYARDYLLDRYTKGMSWGTINIDYSALVLLFKHVLHKPWNYEMLPRPKMPKKLPIILSQNEVIRLTNSINNIKHQTIVITLYATGLRIGELLNLKIQDIDFDGKIIRVIQGKGSKDRTVHVPTKLIEILKYYIERYYPKIYLFNGLNRSEKYSASSVRKIIDRAAQKAQISKKVSPHMFRHCYASHHIEFGTNLVYISRQLGHSTINMTAKYLHLCQYQEYQIVHPLEHLNIQFLHPIP